MNPDVLFFEENYSGDNILLFWRVNREILKGRLLRRRDFVKEGVLL